MISPKYGHKSERGNNANVELNAVRVGKENVYGKIRESLVFHCQL